MISKDSLLIVGKILKTHGINGEMSVSFTSYPYMDAVEPGDCVIMDIDGILTPFFVGSVRSRSSETLLMKFDGIDSQEDAMAYIGKQLWADIEDVPEDEPDEDEDGEGGLYASQLIGYKVYDTDNNLLGEIVDIDETTENALFFIEHPERQKPLLVPIADQFINAISVKKHKLILELPEGLIEL